MWWRRVAAVLRALAVHEPGGATTSSAARTAGLPRPTVHRLLSSLEEARLADRDRDNGRWQLGPELFFLGSAAAARHDAATTAQPFVRRLAQVTGESAFFSARRGDETICLIREEGSFPVRSHVLYEGARFPLGVVSAGMALLAHLPDREVDEYPGAGGPGVAMGRAALGGSGARPSAADPSGRVRRQPRPGGRGQLGHRRRGFRRRRPSSMGAQP